MSLASRIAVWLPSARWFAAKGEAVAQVALHDCCSLADGGITLAVVDVQSAAGQTHRYAVPAASESGVDAATTVAFSGWLVRAVLTGEAVPGRQGSFLGHPTANVPSPAGPVAVRPLGGDASNTSLLVEFAGQAYAVKLLRRCRPGIQPEVELGEFFAKLAPWNGTPRFCGWLEYAPTNMPDESIAIATVHEFAAGCASAWDRLVPLVSTGGLHGPSRAAILNTVTALGRTTAEMHRALGSRRDLAGFAPVAATPAGRRATAERMAEHARHVFALAIDRLPQLPASIADAARAAIANRDRLISQLKSLATLDTTALQIRVHGDYHLGQVLMAGPDAAAAPRVLVIDFEGEPGRTLEDRRAKTSVFKDVAGMCRSFDYLLRHVAKTTGATYRPDDLQALEASFLDAYRTIAGGQPWWPAAPHEADALLAIYKLDKAIYELAYELRNRPDWVDVPLAALG